MASRSRYWSNTGLADWVRGTPKLSCGTSQEWRAWRRQAKSAHPVRFWIAEEALDAVQNAIHWIPDRLYDIKYYINNRFVSRTHSLTAHPSHIRPGTWCDFGNRILPCLFDELVNFVEVELAWKNVAWDKEAREKFKVPFWGVGWFRWRTWRSAESGLDYLKWEQGLINDESWGLTPGDTGYGEPNDQARKGHEVEALYRWYKEVYLNRPDPHDASGWSDYCDALRDEDGDGIFLALETESEEDRHRSKEILDRCREIEQQYRAEDEQMLIRLIKIRESLWT